VQSIVDAAVVSGNVAGKDFFSAENVDNLINSVLKGSIVGGTFAAGVQAPGQFMEVARTKAKAREAQAQMEQEFYGREPTGVENLPIPEPEAYATENPEPTQLDLDLALNDIEQTANAAPDYQGVDPGDVIPVPEGQTDMVAQARALEDPTSSKRAMLITSGSFDPYAANSLPMPPGMERVDMGNGDVIYTQDADVAQRATDVAQRATEEGPSDQFYGDVLYNMPGGKAPDANLVVQVTDPETGGVTTEILTNEENLGRTLEEARFQAGAGRDVNVIQETNGIPATAIAVGARIAKQADQDVANAQADIETRIAALINNAMMRKNGKKKFQDTLQAAFQNGSTESANILADVAKMSPRGQAAFIAEFVDDDAVSAVETTPQNAAELRDAQIADIGPNTTGESTFDRSIDQLEPESAQPIQVEIDLDYGNVNGAEKFADKTYANIITEVNQLKKDLGESSPIISEVVRDGSTARLEFAPSAAVTQKIEKDPIRTPDTNLTRGLPYLTPDLLVGAAIKNAKNSVSKGREKWAEKNKLAARSFIRAKDPRGQWQVLGTRALADSGVHLLMSEQQSTERSLAQLQLDGFLRMQAELANRGWQIQPAAKDTLIYHKELSGKKVDKGGLLSIQDVERGNMIVQRQFAKINRLERELKAIEQGDPRDRYLIPIKQRELREATSQEAMDQIPSTSAVRGTGLEAELLSVQEYTPEVSDQGGDFNYTSPTLMDEPVAELQPQGTQPDVYNERVFKQDQDAIAKLAKGLNGNRAFRVNEVPYPNTAAGREQAETELSRLRNRVDTYNREQEQVKLRETSVRQLDEWVQTNRKVTSRAGRARGPQDSVQGIGRNISQEDVDFTSFIFNQAGLNTGESSTPFGTAVTIIDADSLSDPEIVNFLPTAQTLQKRFADEPNLQGTTFAVKGRRFIVIRPNSKNATEEMVANRKLVLAHEAGHVLLDSARKNLSDGQRSRLETLWNNESKERDIPAWKGKNGFQEWFSDKVAGWAKHKVQNPKAKPKNLAENIFDKVVNQLKRLFNAVKGRVPRRFANNNAFNKFMDSMATEGVFDINEAVATTQGYSDIQLGNPADRIRDVVSPRTLRYGASKVKQGLKAFTNTKVGSYVMTNDALLRSVNEPIGRAIYRNVNERYEAGDTIEIRDGVTVVPGGRSYHEGREYQLQKYIGRLDQILRDVPETDQQKVWFELSREVPTKDLSTDAAVQVRQLLDEFWDDYVTPRMPQMQGRKVENYFPRVFDKIAISGDRDAFVAILNKHGIKDPDKVIKNLTEQDRDYSDSEMGAMIQGWQQQRVFKDQALLQDLVDGGFVNASPAVSLLDYFKQVTSRGEYDRLFGGFVGGKWDSNKRIKEMTKDLSLEDKVKFNKYFKASIFPEHLDPDNPWHNFLGELRAYESFRVLLGSGLASVAELGGIFSRLRGTLDTSEFRTIIARSLDGRTKEELYDFARDMGAVANAATGAMLQDIAADPSLGNKGFFRKHLPSLFKYNGNNAVTDFTRVVATQAARQYIKRIAAQKMDAQNVRRMRELGLTPQAVQRWVRIGEPSTSQGLQGADKVATEQVLFGIHQFVTDSVLRPNASERTFWATDPLGGMVFHLKSFAYSYNKRILGGVAREINDQIEGNEDLKAFMPKLFGAISVFLLLGGITDELRARLFSFGTEGSLDKARGDTGQMMENWATRAGFFSLPFSDIVTNPSPEGVAYSLGPTTHHFYELLFENYGERTEALKLMKSTPGVNQLPVLKKAIVEELS